MIFTNFYFLIKLNFNIFTNFYTGSRKKSPRKTLPDSKPNPIPKLTLILPQTPHGGLFSGGISSWHLLHYK